MLCLRSPGSRRLRRKKASGCDASPEKATKQETSPEKASEQETSFQKASA